MTEREELNNELKVIVGKLENLYSELKTTLEKIETSSSFTYSETDNIYSIKNKLFATLIKLKKQTEK